MYIYHAHQPFRARPVDSFDTTVLTALSTTQLPTTSKMPYPTETSSNDYKPQPTDKRKGQSDTLDAVVL